MIKIYYWTFLICLILNYPIFAQQENKVIIDSKVDEVTIFLNGTEVQTSKEVEVRKGENKLIFNGLSPSLQENSVQVLINNDVEIISVSTNSIPIKPEVIDRSIKMIHDTLNILKDKIEVVKNQIAAFTAEKEMLTENRYIGGSQAGVSVTELSKATDFFFDRTLKINSSMSTLTRRLNTLNLLIDSANAKLQDKISHINTERKQVIVIVSSKTDQKVNSKIRYLVDNANWEATYDLVAEDITKPVLLKYKAQIFNSTGIGWKNVKLTLSTADPSQNATRPFLTAWTLNYSSKDNEGQGLLQNKWTREQTNLSDSAVSFDNIAVDELSTSFNISKPYSIPSDSKPYTIELSTDLLNTTYEYLTIPKIDVGAFLLAKVTGWEKLNLIDGIANVYFGNMYVGKSKIDTHFITDTLELSLGRDNQILVSRNKLEDVSSNKFIGGKRTESFIYEINIKNNRKSPINIKVQDQVPISQESDIIVDVEDISAANRDNMSGRLQWIKKISPTENARFRIAFAVKYPKNKTVSIRKQRIVSTPRYRH